MKIKYWGSLLVGMLSWAIMNVAVAGVEPPALSKQISALFVKYRIPGASIAVVEHGKIIWTQTLGDADLATRRKVTVKTLFPACSITKTLTSAAVLNILQQYHIPLDAPVNRYLKRWQIPENQFTEQQPVTIRMLLNHTAGFSNPYPSGGYAYYAKIPNLTQLFLGQPPANNPPLTITYVPGSQFKYCNGCYAVLQMFLEDVTGKKYPVLMQQQILTPVGMHNSYFDNDLFLKAPTKFALPYDAARKRFPQAPDISPIYATGSLLTTPTDLAKYLIQIQNSVHDHHGLLSEKIVNEMVKPDSTPTRGLGFFIGNKNADEEKGGGYFFHSGNNIGYLTLLIGSLKSGQGAVIMINISPEWNAKDYPQFGFIKDSLKLIATYYHWT